MKTKIKNRIDMYESVLSVLRNNQAIWESTSMIVSRVDRLEEGLIGLHAKSALQSSVTLGVAQMRNARWNDLAKKIISIQDALWIYGNGTNNYDLVARHKFAPSVTFKLSANARAIRIDIVTSDLENYGSFLADYGVTTEMIQQFHDSVAVYRDMTITPRSAIVERKTVRLEIESKSIELNNLLRNDLDRMIRRFSASHPSFVVTYFNARQVVNMRGRRQHRSGPSTGDPDIGN